MAEIENSRAVQFESGKAPGTGLFIHNRHRYFEVVAVDECLVYAADELGEIFIDSSRDWTTYYAPMPPGASGRADKVSDLMPFVSDSGDEFRHRLPPEYLDEVLSLGRAQRDFLVEVSVEVWERELRLRHEMRLKEPIWVEFGEGGRVLSVTYPTPAPQRP